MSNSLFEQLKKSGLVDEKKAKKYQQEKHKNKKNKQKKGGDPSVNEAKLLAQRTLANKVANDRQLNQQRKKEAESKATAARVQQLIEHNKETQQEGDLMYHFTDGTLIKHIYVNEPTQKKLSQGHLAIAKTNNCYALIPVEVAEKVRQYAPEKIILCNTNEPPSLDENTFYEKYKVPDDLIW